MARSCSGRPNPRFEGLLHGRVRVEATRFDHIRPYTSLNAESRSLTGSRPPHRADPRVFPAAAGVVVGEQPGVQTDTINDPKHCGTASVARARAVGYYWDRQEGSRHEGTQGRMATR